MVDHNTIRRMKLDDLKAEYFKQKDNNVYQEICLDRTHPVADIGVALEHAERLRCLVEDLKLLKEHELI